MIDMQNYYMSKIAYDPELNKDEKPVVAETSPVKQAVPAAKPKYYKEGDVIGEDTVFRPGDSRGKMHRGNAEDKRAAWTKNVKEARDAYQKAQQRMKSTDANYLKEQQGYVDESAKHPLDQSGWFHTSAEDKIDPAYRQYMHSKKHMEDLMKYKNGFNQDMAVDTSKGSDYTKRQQHQVNLNEYGIAAEDQYNNKRNKYINNSGGKYLEMLSGAGIGLIPTPLSWATGASLMTHSGKRFWDGWLDMDPTMADLYANDREAFDRKYGDMADTFAPAIAENNAKTTALLNQKKDMESKGLDTTNIDNEIQNNIDEGKDTTDAGIQEHYKPGSTGRDKKGNKTIASRFNSVVDWIGNNPIKSALGAYVLYNMFSGGGGYQMGPMGGYQMGPQQGNIITRNPVLSTAAIGAGAGYLANEGVFGDNMKDWWSKLMSGTPETAKTGTKAAPLSEEAQAEARAKGIEGVEAATTAK